MNDLVIDWCRWALAYPVPESPLTDPSGVRAGLDQRAAAWLVAGNLGGRVERRWQMDAGRRLFFPALNAISRKWLLFTPDPRVEVASAYGTLDGTDVALSELMVRKFPVSSRAGNPFFEPVEDERITASVWGLWGLTDPLSAGSHELCFGGVARAGFEVHVRCLIEAVPNS